MNAEFVCQILIEALLVASVALLNKKINTAQ